MRCFSKHVQLVTDTDFFAREGKDGAVKLKVWNPRSENGSVEATVENGKSVLLTGTDGKALHVGRISSRIQLNGMVPNGVSEVASRKGDTYEIVWTKDGFKPRAKE